VIAQYADNEDGVRELHLYWGDKEITFDEPELFGFGETLAAQAQFVAGDAVQWGDGQPWPQVQELLTVLLDEGILQRAEDAAPVAPRADGARPSPLPPALTTTPRSWLDCEALTEELTGHRVSLGHLELLIPIFRIAHLALDSEGRQVGEANVFPAALRLDVPTSWRACIYAGSRFDDARPMNVSALKSMRAHWPQMMQALAVIREAYLRRYPAARQGWTLGDVECLSTLVLALPTWLLMKQHNPVANGALHPVLSSLFRVTDGLRMTTHQMLFVPTQEATLSGHDRVTAQQIHEYAERNHAFASNHGVCAGPKVMIDEFLAVLLDGAAPREPAEGPLDASLQAALNELDAAFDYGLLGLQAHALVFSMWPAMTRCYAQLGEAAAAWAGPDSPALRELRAHLDDKLLTLKNQTLHATEAWRLNRERAYAHIVAHAARGLGEAPGAGLLRTLADAATAPATRLRSQVSQLLQQRLGARADDVEPMQAALLRYFLQARVALQQAEAVQQRINTLLGRPAAPRPFTAADIDVHVQLQGREARRLPHLLNELGPLLGLHAHITGEGITVRAVAPTEPRRPRDSGSASFADVVSAETGALCTPSH
jgi:hypothetical protein